MAATKAHTLNAQLTNTSVKTTDEEAKRDKREKIVQIIGRIASVLSVIMYVSYVTQIMNNLAGHPGTPWQPLAAFFNCTFWTIYGWFGTKKDWPIIIANIPGIFFAAITFITTFIH